MPKNEETDYDELYTHSSEKVAFGISLAKQIDRINMSLDPYDEEHQLDSFESMLSSRTDNKFDEEMNTLRDEINAHLKKVMRGHTKEIEKNELTRIKKWRNKRRYKILINLMDRAGFMPMRRKRL